MLLYLESFDPNASFASIQYYSVADHEWFCFDGKASTLIFQAAVAQYKKDHEALFTDHLWFWDAYSCACAHFPQPIIYFNPEKHYLHLINDEDPLRLRFLPNSEEYPTWFIFQDFRWYAASTELDQFLIQNYSLYAAHKRQPNSFFVSKEYMYKSSTKIRYDQRLLTYRGRQCMIARSTDLFSPIHCTPVLRGRKELLGAQGRLVMRNGDFVNPIDRNHMIGTSSNPVIGYVSKPEKPPVYDENKCPQLPSDMDDYSLIPPLDLLERGDNNTQSYHDDQQKTTYNTGKGNVCDDLPPSIDGYSQQESNEEKSMRKDKNNSSSTTIETNVVANDVTTTNNDESATKSSNNTSNEQNQPQDKQLDKDAPPSYTPSKSTSKTSTLSKEQLSQPQQQQQPIQITPTQQHSSSSSSSYSDDTLLVPSNTHNNSPSHEPKPVQQLPEQLTSPSTTSSYITKTSSSDLNDIDTNTPKYIQPTLHAQKSLVMPPLLTTASIDPFEVLITNSISQSTQPIVPVSTTKNGTNNNNKNLSSPSITKHSSDTNISPTSVRNINNNNNNNNNNSTDCCDIDIEGRQQPLQHVSAIQSQSQQQQSQLQQPQLQQQSSHHSNSSAQKPFVRSASVSQIPVNLPPQTKKQQLINNPQIIQHLSQMKDHLPTKLQTAFITTSPKPHQPTLQSLPSKDHSSPSSPATSISNSSQSPSSNHQSEFDFHKSNNCDELRAYIISLLAEKAELQTKLTQQRQQFDSLSKTHVTLLEKYEITQKNYDTVESDYQLIQKRCLLLKDIIDDVFDIDTLSPSPIHSIPTEPKPSSK